MFAAPILAFVTTHILYLNFYEMDYGEVSIIYKFPCKFSFDCKDNLSFFM